MAVILLTGYSRAVSRGSSRTFKEANDVNLTASNFSK